MVDAEDSWDTIDAVSDVELRLLEIAVLSSAIERTSRTEAIATTEYDSVSPNILDSNLSAR